VRERRRERSRASPKEFAGFAEEYDARGATRRDGKASRGGRRSRGPTSRSGYSRGASAATNGAGPVSPRRAAALEVRSGNGRPKDRLSPPPTPRPRPSSSAVPNPEAVRHRDLAERRGRSGSVRLDSGNTRCPGACRVLSFRHIAGSEKNGRRSRPLGSYHRSRPVGSPASCRKQRKGPGKRDEEVPGPEFGDRPSAIRLAAFGWGIFGERADYSGFRRSAFGRLGWWRDGSICAWDGFQIRPTYQKPTGIDLPLYRKNFERVSNGRVTRPAGD
jgi:hypothetical protein